MRRTTSALTTTILGAVLSASTVSAQQSLPSASARRAGTATTATTTAKGSDSADDADPSFGMAAARGARYLLRNGLDYIDYQEYERALKYLREAEKRQAELGSSEKLKLKQGIERAGTRLVCITNLCRMPWITIVGGLVPAGWANFSRGVWPRTSGGW